MKSTDQNGDGAPSPKTLTHFDSLHLLSKRSDDERPRDAVEHGAVAGPLAGVRAPQRVSASPSSGLAAVPYRARGGRA